MVHPLLAFYSEVVPFPTHSQHSAGAYALRNPANEVPKGRMVRHSIFATSRRRGLMSRHWLAVLVLIASFGLMTPAVMADNDKDHGKGKSHAKKNNDRDDKGWEKRDGYQYRVYGDRDGRPEGWSRGKKTGWGNCGLPPGQAKKDGCRTYVYQGRPHYYYQDDRGRIIVRRPIIDLHGGVDIVH
jgi:hypothetical protein